MLTFSTHRVLYIPRLLADKAVGATAVETPSGWEDKGPGWHRGEGTSRISNTHKKASFLRDSFSSSSSSASWLEAVWGSALA